MIIVPTCSRVLVTPVLPKCSKAYLQNSSIVVLIYIWTKKTLRERMLVMPYPTQFFKNNLAHTVLLLCFADHFLVIKVWYLWGKAWKVDFRFSEEVIV